MAYTTIDDPTQYFNTVLYSADASTNVSVTVGHQPDFVWIKRRNGSANHVSFDSVRGTQKGLFPDISNAEATEGGSRGLTSFDSNGFTIGAQLQDIAGSINAPSGTYVSWNWKAGGSASSNSDGDITSSVSASTDAGFSIVAWTGNGTAGQTIGHGLGAVPNIIITKGRSSALNWFFFDSMSSYLKRLKLNTTDAQADTDGLNDTAPTSSVFTVSGGGEGNTSGVTYVAYLFAEKKGFSKFGSYIGNGSTDGSFIFLGMKPSMIIVKRTDTTGNWRIYDNKRDTFNYCRAQLSPNLNNAESNDSANTDFDFLSNGFKARGGFSNINASGGTYIYMAFAESPFVNSKGIPTNAR